MGAGEMGTGEVDVIKTMVYLYVFGLVGVGTYRICGAFQSILILYMDCLRPARQFK